MGLSLPRLFPLSRVQQGAQHKGAGCRHCLTLPCRPALVAQTIGLDTGHGTWDPHPFHSSIAHPVWGTGHLVMCYYCCCNILPVIVGKEHEIEPWRLRERERGNERVCVHVCAHERESERERETGLD